MKNIEFHCLNALNATAGIKKVLLKADFTKVKEKKAKMFNCLNVSNEVRRRE